MPQTDQQLSRRVTRDRAGTLRNRKRRQKALLQKCALLFAVLLILGAGVFLLLRSVPKLRVSKTLKDANKALESMQYDEALVKARDALRMDDTSVEAYRVMSRIYFGQEDYRNGVQTLKEGYESTSDETLRHDYCVYTLNNVVAEINDDRVTFDTLAELIEVLRNEPSMTEAYPVFDALCDKLFTGDKKDLLCNMENPAACSFDRYLDLLKEMLTICRDNGASADEALQEELIRLATPRNSLLYLEVRHLEDYRAVLKQIAERGSDPDLEDLIACLNMAISVQDMFGEAFASFESDDMSPIRDFMQKEQYITLRDAFLDGSIRYWSGATYIPVSREFCKLSYEEGYSFSFASFKEYEDTAGVISLWATRQEDAGVPRLVISYEPAESNGEYLPHITYEVLYLYSNVKIGNEYVPQMNYRLEKRIATSGGTDVEVTGDWGGEHEWNDEF